MVLYVLKPWCLSGMKKKRITLKLLPAPTRRWFSETGKIRYYFLIEAYICVQCEFNLVFCGFVQGPCRLYKEYYLESDVFDIEMDEKMASK
jgi:hypothetical protein